MTYLLFGTALTLSAVAEFYAIMGLIAIFAGAPISIAIMGVTLGVAKLTITSWLYRYWNKTSLIIKTYFIIAIVILMSLTSMGIFGYLSKAHLDQGASTGEAQAKVQIYDEKIKTAKENIDANRKVLKQMDEAVDQVMGRSTSETGADKAVAIRRSQQKERARIALEIATEQKTISSLSEERAPLAAEVRKVEAEVGPIKYIAALIYGDNLDSNMLESAVRIMIIMIVVVFDPLAVLMFIAYNQTITQTSKPQIQVIKQEPIEDSVLGNDLEFEVGVRVDDKIIIEKW
jgi:hypothetical protein